MVLLIQQGEKKDYRNHCEILWVALDCVCVCEYCLLLWGKEHALETESTDSIAQDTYHLLIFNDGLFSIKEHNATELSQSIFVFFSLIN